MKHPERDVFLYRISVREGEEMRRSNWKGKVLMAVAILIGIICALAVTIAIPEGYSQYRGLTFFGAFILVAGILIVIGTKIFRIGED